MTAITLQITSPTHNTALIGSPGINLRGKAQVPPEVNNVPLYYRWYDSLFSATKDHYSIHETPLSDPDINFPHTLKIGSHTITLAVSDQPGQTESDQNATQHGGVAGGADACVIHVFKANIIEPDTNESISRSNLILIAEAPLKWGMRLRAGDPYVPDMEGYHKVNRLRYRWVFAPQGDPAGRPTMTIIPTLSQMTFMVEPDAQQPTELARLIFQPAGTILPAAVDGAYSLTLFVEDNTTENIGSAQMSINVFITG
jgi:hypothetical protein